MSAEIAQWLGQLGLGQYAAAFSSNDIDFGVIGDLSDADLRELGVSMGHRKILLKAIAARVGHAPPDAASRDAVHEVAERRQLTVMFCDLVNSTGLAERYDPEVLKGITETFRDCCERSVKRFGGNIGGLRGDGLLVYFGYPEANEHDPERAIRAGLEIVRAVRELETHPRLSLECRIGIATGEVVVGDLVGSDLTQECDVTGVVPSLAARLQQLTEPNAVLVSDVTRRLAGNVFDYSDLGPVMLKGFAGEHSLWRVDGESLIESRFEATHSAAELSPMVGREQELAEILRRWKLVQAGNGQTVLLLGEAGIGKSRMVHSLREELRNTDHAVLLCSCVEHHRNSALFPIITHLERAAGFERGEALSTKFEKIEALVEASGGDATNIVPLYSALLSVPMDDRFAPLTVTPELQKERTLAALETHLQTLARSRAVLIVLEDVHWADPTTEEFVERVLGWLSRSAILLLATARSGYSASWMKKSHVSTLKLERLSHDISLDLIAHVSRADSIPKQILWEIVAKSDGIPLYLEEMTKAVIERKRFENAQGYAVLGMSVPNTLQDSLAARLDRLPRAKRVAQIGATIGRQFTFELLAAVCPLPRAQLEKALDQLTAAELLTCEGAAPDAVYTFKHALLQDWAYENQLKTERPRLHRSIAKALEQRFSDALAARPEVLAHHYGKAGDYGESISYWQLAARRSADRAAYAEALEHLSHALGHLEKLGDDPQRDKIELELRVARGLSLERTMGYGAPQVKETYERARLLCQKLGETVDMVPVLLGLYVFHLVRAENSGDLVTAQELAEQCAQLSLDSGRQDYLVASYASLGYARCYLGRLTDAREVLDSCVRLGEQSRELEFTITAQHPTVASLALLGVVLWLLGYADESLERIDRAFALADQIGKPINHAVVCAHAAQLHQLRRESDKAAEYAERGLALSKEHGYPSWEAACSMHLGIARASSGDASGITLASRYLDAWRAGGAGLNRPYFLAGIAQAEIIAGRPNEASAHIDEALAHARRTGEVYFVPLLHQIRGEYSAGGNRRDAAEADFRRAYEESIVQQSRMFELRSLCGLRRLASAAGRPSYSAELAHLVKDLSAGGETLDLSEALSLCG
jgi:class 3 adenylate cyclase/tetratricopeptide (TPR) repeat protein